MEQKYWNYYQWKNNYQLTAYELDIILKSLRYYLDLFNPNDPFYHSVFVLKNYLWNDRQLLECLADLPSEYSNVNKTKS